ncbi:MAG TPA: DUF2178 domain-containing protein [bacterium]|nr:DUF2178 domain-containing protein [bacterium]HPT30129.1 DUF2178 domain-containing protein [bacterium]
MTLKQFKIVKLVFVMILAIVFSQAIVFKNYLIPIVLMIVSALILMLLRRRVKGIIADERDYATGGKSALLAMQIYGWVAAMAMFIFYAGRDINPAYEPIALTLAFSTCLLMILYAAIFRYHSHFKFSAKKSGYIILMVILFALLFIFAARLFSGEDNWVCTNGSWEKHGQPGFPAPQTECR